MISGKQLVWDTNTCNNNNKNLILFIIKTKHNKILTIKRLINRTQTIVFPEFS